jgi:transcriptional regulator with XRE-family HTH domain
MEFNEKLQELRKQKNMTQDELAEHLYVSRTAISKWESGRGYPSIESLKAIAKFFSVTIDDLLSSNEALEIAEQENKQKQTQLRDLIFGLIDVSFLLLLFLPFFTNKTGEAIQSLSLISLFGVQSYLKILYFILVAVTSLMGVMMLSLQNCQISIWLKSKIKISLALTVLSVLLFIISSQPYAAVFSFLLLLIKAATLKK